MKVEEIRHSGELWAILFKGRPSQEGVHFYTKDENTVQVGDHFQPKGKVIRPHAHQPVSMNRNATLQEVLVIEEGRVKITFYTREGRAVDERILEKGDKILLMEGGHGFEFLEPTRMLEIKQGPYQPQATVRLEVRETV